jgi:hypothetical protein
MITAVLVSSFIIAGLGIVGSYLQGRKTMWGWAVGFSSEVLWIVSGLLTAQWGLSIAGLAYASLAAHNFFKWRREEREDHETPSNN